MIPKTHPRYDSLVQRENIVAGVKQGLTSQAGLVAQGRGEAFDYLLGERTTSNAKAAMRAAVSRMLTTKTVLSCNGNVVALCSKEYVALSKALNAPIEVNLFNRTEERMNKIRAVLKEAGAEVVYGTQPVLSIDSERSKISVSSLEADTILVPLEDGDRAEALVAEGKFVITIDLNPKSRTARKADITIVDNIVRAVPFMTELAKQGVDSIDFNNEENLLEAMQIMRDNLQTL